MTIPAYIHQALIPLDAPPRPACDGSGPSAAHAADVTCPDCLTLAADRKARTEVHDTHAIPADDEPDTLADWERELLAAKAGPVVAVEWPAPAKTHDLTVDRNNGNVVITVEGLEGEHQVYLQEGVALDLGRALAPLTSTQRQLLIDDLTGGAK